MVAIARHREELPWLAGGRLTLESGVPISSSDQTGKTTFYYTPYLHNRISLFIGGRWRVYQFSELSIALGTLTDATNYDVFAYPSGATAALEFSDAWSSATARSEALTTQDGIYVKSGETDRRYLGSFRTTATTTTEDSESKRLVWNADNRVVRHVVKNENGATANWPHTTASWRAAKAVSANRIEVLAGLGSLSEASIACNVDSNCTTDGVGGRSIGIGFDTTSTNSGNINSYVNNNTLVHHECNLYHRIPIGWHYYQWVEYGGTDVTFNGTGGDTTLRKSGLSGTVVI